MAKVSKSEVMKEAHRIRRWLLSTYAKWQIDRGVVDVSLARCLSAAWRNVKERVAATTLPALSVEQTAAVKLEQMRHEARTFRQSSIDRHARIGGDLHA